jgi:hypothetical protein
VSNFGVRCDGRRVKTKKELKDLVKAGVELFCYDTSSFSNRGVVKITDLQPTDVIVGPDPETSRAWFANYKDGKIV